MMAGAISGGREPVGAPEEMLVPLRAEAGGGEAEICRRGEGERDDDEDRQDEVEQDERHDRREPQADAARRPPGGIPPHVRARPKACSTPSARTDAAKMSRAAASRITAHAEGTA